MPFTLTMPKLSPTMEEGVIAKWKKKPGDLVKEGEPVMEVATDKAVVEYQALDRGFLRKILVEEGKETSVGSAVAVFSETLEEDISSYTPESVRKEPEEIKPVPVEEKQSTEEPIAPPKNNTSSSYFRPEFVPEPPLTGYTFSRPACDDEVRASPYAKKRAEELGIDLRSVRGTGPRGRISGKDVERGCPKTQFRPSGAPSVIPGTYEEEPLSPMRKVIARRLEQAKSFIPHFYVTKSVDAEPMIAFRSQLAAGGVKVTFNDIVLRATALALREHPAINSGFHTVNQSIIRFKTIDIAVAVSVPDGLITPIIRHADYKSLITIGAEMKLLGERAKLGKLSREEYMGGSFTVSNLGMFGISDFQGIINPPQAAILCVGGMEEVPVVKNGSVVPGKVMKMSVSADHRAVDGADVAAFLASLSRFLLNPALLAI